MNYFIFELIKQSFRMGWHLSLDHIRETGNSPGYKEREKALDKFLDAHVPGGKVFLDKQEEPAPNPDDFVERLRDKS